MNKLVAVLGIVIILLSAVCGILYYQIGDMQSQNSDLQNQIGQLENQVSELESQLDETETQLGNVTFAKITGLTTFGFDPWGGTAIFTTANVTVENLASGRLFGSELWIKHTSMDDYGNRMELEPLDAGETRTVSIAVIYNSGEEGNFVATLKLDGIILDEYTYPPVT